MVLGKDMPVQCLSSGYCLWQQPILFSDISSAVLTAYCPMEKVETEEIRIPMLHRGTAFMAVEATLISKGSEFLVLSSKCFYNIVLNALCLVPSLLLICIFKK